MADGLQDDRAMTTARLLSMQAISKSFDGVRVLQQVAFDLQAGEVHVLAGENGAGKSTLMKILAGGYSDYEGRVLLDDRPCRWASPQQAAAQGVAMIHQELSLIPELSVVDNIFLGREHCGAFGWLKPQRQRQEARRRLSQLDLDLELNRPAGEYPLAIQQLIEIAKALTGAARILIMDEPTSALNESETQRLFAIIRSLRQQLCGIVFITHKLEEMYQIGDRLTVLRDGRIIVTSRIDDLKPNDLIRALVGRELRQQFPARQARPGPVRLAVEGLSLRDPVNPRRLLLDRVSFAAHSGEILGFAGLQGCGASELFQALAGVYGRLSGIAGLDGRPLRLCSPRRALAQGLAFLSNDRKGRGLVPGLNVVHNITLAALRSYSPRGWLKPRREWAAALAYREEFRIAMRSPSQEVQELSGGNQQKVLLARWLETHAHVLLLDEPTRGVDVGAKHDLYELMNQWTAAGLTIMLITSELPELLAMADRIIVLHRGRITGTYARGEATPELVLRAAMGAAEA
ncbi:MAG: sugar ABC transporter ATP-binding protein [Lentisphaerae bacterium]|nr:sugar ABC transporter ATP-binding protein [Lentisphaerota bacterium]